MSERHSLSEFLPRDAQYECPLCKSVVVVTVEQIPFESPRCPKDGAVTLLAGWSDE